MAEIIDNISASALPTFLDRVEVEGIGTGLAIEHVFPSTANQNVITATSMDDVIAAESENPITVGGAGKIWPR